MAKIKGSDIVTLKKLFSKNGGDAEKKFLSCLLEDDSNSYKQIVATSWTDINVQARIYEAAAKALFPGEQNPVVKLHQKLAEQSYSGIYSVFLAIPKPSYVFKRAASVWSTYYDTGVASIENITDSSMDFVVRDFPDLPQAMRDATTGHITVLLGKTGLKNLEVKHDGSNPQKWSWHTQWR